MRGTNIHLVPSLFDAGAADEFAKSGQTLSAVWSGRDDSLAVFSSPTPDSIAGPSRASKLAEPTVYVAGSGPPPDHRRREFIADASVVYNHLQETMNQAQAEDFRKRNTLYKPTLNKIGFDFLSTVKGHWLTNSQSTAQDGVFKGDHYRVMFASFDLFNILYLPDPDQVNASVGEPLMDWLNRNFVDPPSDEGDALSKLSRPWESDGFWPYIARAVLRGLAQAPRFFLETLSAHPQPEARATATLLGALIADMPRLTRFTTLKAFESARDAWRGQVRLAREALVAIPEAARDDGFENWWNWASDIVGVLEGSEYILGDLCKQLGVDWKGVVAARALFAKKLPRRGQLPKILKKFGGRDEEDDVLSDSEIPHSFEPDPTDPEDMVHFYLMMGNMPAALSYAAQHDIWLAAHFSVFMEEHGLLKEWNAKLGLDLRDHYVLEYADHLQSDPGLWRITVSYLYTCGEVGARRADELLLRVPLQVGAAQPSDEMQQDGNVLEGDLIGVLQELNETARRYEREETRRMICKLAARQFLEQGYFHLAVSYFGNAQDWAGLGRAVDRVLDESLVKGPEYLVEQVQNCVKTIQELLATGEPIGICAQRIAFARLYAAFFHDRRNQMLPEAAEHLVVMLRDGIAPKAWWGVLFTDGLELLQHGEQMVFTADEATDLLYKLQEIDAAVAQGAGEDYLAVLMKKRGLQGAKEALAALQPVRLALARYMGRCHVVHVGGRDASALPPRAGAGLAVHG